jgi:hypothetical protein
VVYSKKANDRLSVGQADALPVIPAVQVALSFDPFDSLVDMIFISEQMMKRMSKW